MALALVAHPSGGQEALRDGRHVVERFSQDKRCVGNGFPDFLPLKGLLRYMEGRGELGLGHFLVPARR
jgi:hypothetical protein